MLRTLPLAAALCAPLSNPCRPHPSNPLNPPLKTPATAHHRREGQDHYLFGRDPLRTSIADIPTDHPTCSKQHAVLQYRRVTRTSAEGLDRQVVLPYILDLGRSARARALSLGAVAGAPRGLHAAVWEGERGGARARGGRFFLLLRCSEKATHHLPF